MRFATPHLLFRGAPFVAYAKAAAINFTHAFSSSIPRHGSFRRRVPRIVLAKPIRIRRFVSSPKASFLNIESVLARNRAILRSLASGRYDKKLVAALADFLDSFYSFHVCLSPSISQFKLSCSDIVGVQRVSRRNLKVSGTA